MCSNILTELTFRMRHGRAFLITNPKTTSNYGCSTCAQRHRNPLRIKGIYKKVLNVQPPDWRCGTFCVKEFGDAPHNSRNQLGEAVYEN